MTTICFCSCGVACAAAASPPPACGGGGTGTSASGVGPLLPDEPVSRSFDRSDLQALAHFRNCYSSEQVPQPYFAPFLPQHPYEGAFECFACIVAESHRSCMRTSEL